MPKPKATITLTFLRKPINKLRCETTTASLTSLNPLGSIRMPDCIAYRLRCANDEAICTPTRIRMPDYRRAPVAGATYFFTLALADRRSGLLVSHIEALRLAYRRARDLHPFATVAICVMPEHLHAIWRYRKAMRILLCAGVLSRTDSRDSLPQIHEQPEQDQAP